MADSPNFWQRGGAWVVVQLALFLGWALLPVWPLPFLAGWPGWVAGAVLAVAGVGVLVPAVLALGAQLRTTPQPAPEAELRTSGVFGLVRHPVYLGVLLGFSAGSCLLASATHFGGVVVLAGFFAAKARREEQWLRARFPGYADYARRVPALLPWPR